MPTNLIVPPGLVVASHMPLDDYTPDFWVPEKAYVRYEPDLEGAFLEGLRLRNERNLPTAAQLIRDGLANTTAMLVDLQNDFTDFRDRPGRLPVAGTCDAVLRICARLINGTVNPFFTDVIASQDGHPAWHISYGARWYQARAGRPALDMRVHKAAFLELVDRDRAVFRAQSPGPQGLTDLGLVQSLVNAADTVAYWDHLQQTGQGPIWVFAEHCRLGTDGVDLHPLVQETLEFMAGTRLIEPTPLTKGHIRDTDWFGPLEPCRPDPRHPQGSFQKGTVEQFERAKRVEFSGVAEDFCLFYMERQTIQYFPEDSPFFRNMAFATNGTAAIVPHAPHVLALRADADHKGVKFFECEQPFSAVA